MSILAHPDDESLGFGGTLARYAAEGVETSVICATRGERGRFGDAVERPGLDVVGKAREAELRAAAVELGVREVHFLDYLDKDLDQANAREAIERIVGHIRRVRPQVIISFGPDGGYGHPDHIAISQFAGAAIVCAADPSYILTRKSGDTTTHHRVDKYYNLAWTYGKWKAYTEAFRDLMITVDGVDRRAIPFPDWEITTVIDTEKYWECVWRAVRCHKTQLTIYEKLQHLSEENHRQLWGSQEFYRVFSTVNGGRVLETDLFEGLRR
jgi:LmbE family N-acetylglucosaminyl deacetylase